MVVTSRVLNPMGRVFLRQVQACTVGTVMVSYILSRNPHCTVHQGNRSTYLQRGVLLPYFPMRRKSTRTYLYL